jgi:signal transduction histidine kinase
VSAETVNDILRYVTAVAFGVLGAVALVLWLRRRSRPSLWAALCFSSLGGVALVGRLLPEDPSTSPEIVAQRALVIALILFPYFLFRFTAAFDPASLRLNIGTTLSTAALIAWTIALPDIPASGEHRTVGFSLYIYALVLQFGVLSTIAAYRLWMAGHEQPSVARNRMRLLSLAAIALTAALFTVALIPAEEYALQIVVNSVAIASALIFLLGLAPPEVVRAVWRRPEQEESRRAIGGLMATTEPDDVVESVLPAMRGLVGARAVFLLGSDGSVLGSLGAEPPVPSEGPDILRLDLEGVSMVVVASTYAPFFGSDEVELLRSLGALTGLALDRSRLFVQEREQRIALERADELKTNFIALAAHELRTPVTSVHGVVQTLDRLGDQLPPEARRELAEALRSQSERMRSLVDQLLDLSRLDAETVPINPVRIPVRAEVEALIAASAQERNGDIEVRIPESLETVVDRTVFDRVVSNLLTNAVRHGNVPIVVTAAQGDNHFRLVVEDSGEGVPAQFVDDLFERFSRSDEARSRGQGSGLGLSIARSYARAHGGDLVHEEVRPHGARFELVVPVGRALSSGD